MFWPVAIFMAISMAIGLYTYTKVRGSGKRFAVCERSLPFIVVGTALMAQAVDRNSTLGAVSLTEALKRDARQWAAMDVLLLPTAGTIYTKDAVAADPIQLNTNLGYYTNFVNLMDLAAVAVPAGFRADGLPFGVSLIGPAFSDSRRASG